jgi:hypothetical protein
MSDSLIPPANGITEPWQRNALRRARAERSPYPQRISVEVTARHLSFPASKTLEMLHQAITEAIAQVPGLTDLPYHQLQVSMDQVTVWGSHRIAHDARYWLPNDLWTLAARHRAGRRVKPGTFKITAVFRRNESGCQS